MRRVLALPFLFLAGLAPAQPSGGATIAPTAFTFKKAGAPLGEVGAELSKSPAGVAVRVEPQLLKAKLAASVDAAPFWEALETAADRANARLSVREGGRAVTLEPRPGRREISAVSGPFRVVPRAVTGRLLLDSGASFHEVQLDVHWEPRMPVYRIDSQPRVTKAQDDRGTALRAEAGTSRHYPAAALTDLRVRVDGLTRDSRQIATLAGEFRATASPKLLTIPFQNLAAKSETRAADGVKAVLKSFKLVGGMWEAELELTYPENQPAWESFEEQKWLRDNRLRLVAPDATPYEPDNDDVTASGRVVTAVYRYKLLQRQNPLAKGWSLVAETPAPLVEVTVPFTLKDIPLP